MTKSACNLTSAALVFFLPFPAFFLVVDGERQSWGCHRGVISAIGRNCHRLDRLAGASFREKRESMSVGWDGVQGPTFHGAVAGPSSFYVPPHWRAEICGQLLASPVLRGECGKKAFFHPWLPKPESFPPPSVSSLRFVISQQLSDSCFGTFMHCEDFTIVNFTRMQI